MININLNNDIVIGDVTISNDKYGRLFFNLNGFGNGSLTDNVLYITDFCKILDYQFDSILIGGLGLGMVPYFIENNMNITNITVIENNQNVIDAINQLNHLKKTNIIYDDFKTHSTDVKYDLILADIWWKRATNDEIQMILSNYSNNLNEGGSIHFPINEINY